MWIVLVLNLRCYFCTRIKYDMKAQLFKTPASFSRAWHPHAVRSECFITSCSRVIWSSVERPARGSCRCLFPQHAVLICLLCVWVPLRFFWFCPQFHLIKFPFSHIMLNFIWPKLPSSIVTTQLWFHRCRSACYPSPGVVWRHKETKLGSFCWIGQQHKVYSNLLTGGNKRNAELPG